MDVIYHLEIAAVALAQAGPDCAGEFELILAIIDSLAGCVPDADDITHQELPDVAVILRRPKLDGSNSDANQLPSDLR